MSIERDAGTIDIGASGEHLAIALILRGLVAGLSPARRAALLKSVEADLHGIHQGGETSDLAAIRQAAGVFVRSIIAPVRPTGPRH